MNKKIVAIFALVVGAAAVGTMVDRTTRQIEFDPSIWKQGDESGAIRNERYRMMEDLRGQLETWKPSYERVLAVLGKPSHIGARDVSGRLEQDTATARYPLGHSRQYFVRRAPYYLLLEFDRTGTFSKAGVYPD